MKKGLILCGLFVAFCVALLTGSSASADQYVQSNNGSWNGCLTDAVQLCDGQYGTILVDGQLNYNEVIDTTYSTTPNWSDLKGLYFQVHKIQQNYTNPTALGYLSLQDTITYDCAIGSCGGYMKPFSLDQLKCFTIVKTNSGEYLEPCVITNTDFVSGRQEASFKTPIYWDNDVYEVTVTLLHPEGSSVSVVAGVINKCQNGNDPISCWTPNGGFTRVKYQLYTTSTGAWTVNIGEQGYNDLGGGSLKNDEIPPDIVDSPKSDYDKMKEQVDKNIEDGNALNENQDPGADFSGITDLFALILSGGTNCILTFPNFGSFLILTTVDICSYPVPSVISLVVSAVSFIVTFYILFGIVKKVQTEIKSSQGGV